jgi:hypothetical protein
MNFQCNTVMCVSDKQGFVETIEAELIRQGSQKWVFQEMGKFMWRKIHCLKVTNVSFVIINCLHMSDIVNQKLITNSRVDQCSE